LQSRVDGSIFTDSFFSSSAFQFGHHDKTVSLNSISSFYGTSGSCMTFFDDAEHNRPYADRAGVYFQKVDPSRGVTWHDYSEGLKGVRNRCHCR
jgi:hypothetical protein